MAAANRPVFTENFAANLRAIESFLADAGSTRFERLLDRLLSDIVPSLRRFPRSGRSFLSHQVRSTKASQLERRLARRLAPGDDLREFVVDEYLVLYLVRSGRLIFLAIRHHRQLSFDLKRFWQEP